MSVSPVRTRPRRARMPACTRACGFGLVEVLVATLLVAVAMLGVARLQLGAFAAGRHSLDALATQAHVLGLADRIRALHDAPPAARALLGGPGADRDCRGPRRCTPAEFAEHEAWSWHDEARALRDVTSAPIDVRLGASPAEFALRIRTRNGATWAVEVTS